MKPLIVFGSQGIGEVVQYSALIKKFTAQWDVTLVVPTWQLPIIGRSFKTVGFHKSEAQHVKKGTRKIVLAPAFAARLGLPKTDWVYPLGDEIEIGDQSYKSGIVRKATPWISESLVERMLKEYGFATNDTKFYVGHPEPSLPNNLTVAFVNSGDLLRRLPTHVMNAIMDRFQGVRFVFIGSKYPEQELVSPGNHLEFVWSLSLDSTHTRKCFNALGSSDLVLGTDCGWAHIGLALGKYVVIVQSRATEEALVPASLWGKQFVIDRKTALTCDRQCEAQRVMVAINAGHDLMPDWHDRSLMTEDWVQNVLRAGYPTSLKCWQEKKPDCLLYGKEDVDRLVGKMIGLFPALGHFRV